MMFSTTPAASRQARFASRRYSKEWRQERQAEQGQQRNGQKLTQWCYRSTSRRPFARRFLAEFWLGNGDLLPNLFM